jgi:hypothetical protein
VSVVNTDMQWRFSVSAAAGNTTAGTAAASLGDQVSTTQLTTAVLGNLFDDVSAAEASAGDVEYRCIFLVNTNATDTSFNTKVSITGEQSGGATFDIALDNIGVTAIGSSSAQAATVADEATAPSGVGAYGKGPLTIGTMGPSTVQGVWVRRTAAAGATANSNDGGTIHAQGEG